MVTDYKQIQNQQNPNDIGQAINLLIQDHIKNVNTCFLAKIQSINGNKVSIVKAIKDKQTDKDTIYNNCMVGFPYSGHWITQFKLKKGDIGLALVSQDDVSHYKNTGSNGLSTVKRVQDRNDSIFLPLSMFSSLVNDNINYLIENDNKSCKLEFNNQENGTLKAKLLTLQSETTTLKSKLRELAEILDSAMILQTPSGIQPFDGTTRGNFSNWKSSLDTLFKD